MIDKKKKHLIEYSIKTFQNSNMGDVQTNARKATELFCKLLILSHFGEKKGNDIIFSQDDEFNKKFKVSNHQEKQTREFVLSMLIKVIFQKSKIIDKCYEKKYSGHELKKTIIGYKEYLQRYINVLIFSGNASAHPSYVRFNSDDVIVVQKILAKLLYWLFDEFFEENIPDKLMPYIGKYDIFLSYRHSKKEWIETLKENLENQGYRLFIDKYEMIGGENFKLRLKKAINNSQTAILVISADYADSEWIAKEYEWMREKSLDNSSFRIIPILIDAFSASPDKNLHTINFIKRDYKDVFYELVCAIERKSANSKIEIDENKIVVPTIEKISKEDELKIKIDFSILQKLNSSLISISPTIIINHKNISKEIEFFLEKVKPKFDFTYNLHSPKLEELTYAQKILVEEGILDNFEQRYIKDIAVQSKFYRNSTNFINIRDWIDVLNTSIYSNKKNLIIFKLSQKDELYQKLFLELYNTLFANYPKNLKIIILTKEKTKRIEEIFTNHNILKI